MKIGFVSLGCPKNLVDSEVMMGLSQEGGHTLTPNPAEADVLVVNTCAFIDSAKEESVNTILELAEFKKTGNCKRLVVTGCLGERYRDELKTQIPEIDAVLGTGEVPEIVGAIEGAAQESDDSVNARSDAQSPIPNPQSLDLPTYLYDAEIAARVHDAEAFRLHQGRRGLRLQVLVLHHPDAAWPLPQPDGRGDRPRGTVARGPRRARADPDFAGHHVLRPRSGRRARRSRRCCASSTRSTASTGSGCSTFIRRPSPTTSSTRWPNATRSCKYIDLPLQHAADDVLRRMKRPGTGRHYEKLLARIRERVPGVSLRTTFIVGFPGETEAEFEELCAFVRSVGFDHVGVFTYSHEEGTTAHDLADDVPAAIKKKRRNTLMAEQKRIVARAQKRAGRRPGAGHGGRPLSRARARLAGAAGRSGAGNRPGGVFYRRQSRDAAARRAFAGRNRGVSRVRFGGAPLVINF